MSTDTLTRQMHESRARRLIAAETRAAIQRDLDAALAHADAEIAAKAAESEARIGEIRAGALDSVAEVARDTARALVEAFGASTYQRGDAPATPEQKAALGKLAPDAVSATTLAGEEITAKLSHAPGNGAPIGGLKVQTEHAWFAARPSGTEDVYKLYAESLRGPEHLAEVQAEARAVVAEALGSA